MSATDDLLAAARTDVDSGWLPACQVAIARDNEIVAFETYGDATNSTRFPVHSATKPIVASAVWLLIDEGLLDVSRPVGDYIPEFKANGKGAITVEQVMLHTAGFPTPTMDFVRGADPEFRAEEFARWELEWEPGSRFEYHATSAHWVLADLIGRLSGIDFRDYIEQRVCAPHGLPRVLGIPEDQQDDIAPLVTIGGEEPMLGQLENPAARAAGVPGGGGTMTAATMARFYQALLHNPHGVWSDAVLTDAKNNIRCRFEDPLLGVAVNRTLGLVLAGDDGMHMLRYAIFGQDNSPGAFGHAGAHAQVAWADPETGVSFAYFCNAMDADLMREALRSNRLSTMASQLFR